MLPNHLKLVRMSSGGTSEEIAVSDWESCYQEVDWVTAGLITNSDTGVLVIWAGGATDNVPEHLEIQTIRGWRAQPASMPH
jgi:hypothetical protein